MADEVPSILGWRCYQPGDLNPQLNSFDSYDLLSNSVLASYSSNSMSSVGEALGRLIRPDMTRGAEESLVRAVVLGGYVVEGQEAISYNISVDPANRGASVNRVQMLYIRVPELTSLPDPHCSDNSFGAEQTMAVVEMHPTAAVPNWVSTQPTVVPGSIVEVEFTEGFSRGIVKNILNEATDLQSMIRALGASAALSAGGAGVFLGAPIKGAEGSHEFVELMKASPHLKDFSDPVLAALAANAQHESGFVINAHGDHKKGYTNVSNPKVKERVERLSLGGYCSHGFWQMNVCATGGGGQRFAAYHNIPLTDKEALVAAFADQEKQFEVIAMEMRELFGDDVIRGSETAEYYAGRISAEYERCHSCHKGGDQWTSRSKVAMGIYSAITTTTTIT